MYGKAHRRNHFRHGRADLGNLADVAFFHFSIITNIRRDGEDRAGMGVGSTDDRRRIAGTGRHLAQFPHYAPLVIGGHGGTLVGQLDGVFASQLAINDNGALYLVVYPVRVQLHASQCKWR